MEKIRSGIQDKYKKVAETPEEYFKYPVGRDGAAQLGYDMQLLSRIPEEVVAGFCGVGNPFAIKRILPGSKILDLGCGCGFDMTVASELTGANGEVVGVDLTAEMVDRARSNLSISKAVNCTVIHIASENLPFNNETFDVVISNGVINLSPAKKYLFNELYRVLKKGGSLQIADIILNKDLPPHLAGGVESWSQ